MYRPKVSILIPCYNAANYIEETINSIINQVYPYKEIIIRDDCSTDGTWDLLKKLSKVLPLKIYQNQKNLGMCGNWNKLFDDANGEMILKLDADDILESKFLTNAINIFENQQNLDAVAFAYKILYSDTESKIPLEVHKNLPHGTQHDLFKTIFFKNPFHLCFTIFRTEALLSLKENNKLFLETEIGDLDLLLRFAKYPFSLYFTKQNGGYYRYHSSNSSKEPLKQAKSWINDVFPRHAQHLHKNHKLETSRALKIRIIHYLKSLYAYKQQPDLRYLFCSIKTYLKFSYGKV